MAILPGLVIFGIGLFTLGWECKASADRGCKLNPIVFGLGFIAEIGGLVWVMEVSRRVIP